MKELKRYGLDSFDCIVPMSDGGLYMRDEADARIAELTAEVSSLRVVVTQSYEEGFKAGIQYQAAEDDTGLDYWTAWNKSIARNALKDGK